MLNLTSSQEKVFVNVLIKYCSSPTLTWTVSCLRAGRGRSGTFRQDLVKSCEFMSDQNKRKADSEPKWTEPTRCDLLMKEEADIFGSVTICFVALGLRRKWIWGVFIFWTTLHVIYWVVSACLFSRWQEPLWHQQWRLQPPVSPQQQDVHLCLSHRLQEGGQLQLCHWWVPPLFVVESTEILLILYYYN